MNRYYETIADIYMPLLQIGSIQVSPGFTGPNYAPFYNKKTEDYGYMELLWSMNR